MCMHVYVMPVYESIFYIFVKMILNARWLKRKRAKDVKESTVTVGGIGWKRMEKKKNKLAHSAKTYKYVRNVCMRVSVLLVALCCSYLKWGNLYDRARVQVVPAPWLITNQGYIGPTHTHTDTSTSAGTPLHSDIETIELNLQDGEHQVDHFLFNI